MPHRFASLRMLILLLTLLGALAFARAEDAKLPFLHPLFQDHMVLQRGIAAPVWGWADPGTKVTVTLNGKTATATADAQGKWLAKLGPFTAGGPYALTVAGPQNVMVNDVLIGDVWICSGQSNMQMGIGAAQNAQEEIKNANYPQLRLFTVPNRVSVMPQQTLGGKWDPCTPETVAANGWGGFSAAGYYFGRELLLDQKVPIGLIHTSWGGTVAQAWTSGDALKTMPDFAPAVGQIEQVAADIRDGKYDYDKQLREWWAANDPGTAAEQKWQDPAFDAKEWKTMALPAGWEGAGLPNFDGIVWFRKEVTVPDDWAGEELTLSLGPIDDNDTTWFNGEQVGSTNGWSTVRTYKIPGKLVRAGRNVIAVRVLDTGGGGGIYGKPDQLRLEQAEDPKANIVLVGPWQYRESKPLAQMAPVPMRMDNNPNTVTVLYNGMVAPLLPFAIKGAIWYQGEANAGNPMQYRTLLPTMIKDWRAHFGVGDFPFFIVSLAGFMAVQTQPSEDGWAGLRESQWLTAQTVPNTGLALAIDIGEANDIHPKNKQEVGRRLALAAEAIAYGKKIEYSGPMYQKMAVEGNKIRLTFTHVGGGLVAKNGDVLKGFAIAGADNKFTWADAIIDGDTIVVSSAQVAVPATVRYDWANNPIGNLYNKAGLPAVPFRTDIPK